LVNVENADARKKRAEKIGGKIGFRSELLGGRVQGANSWRRAYVIFRNTDITYKFFWFLSLLDKAKVTGIRPDLQIERSRSKK
jgi:hypothetical protein